MRRLAIKLKLKKYSPSQHLLCKDKLEALKKTIPLQKKLYDLLYLMFAHNKYSLLIILQGIDTSGKDGTVRHIFAGANPQGIKVFSFKKPTQDEVRHDFLWRCHLHTPESGLAAIFNRSYYEEVTTVIVKFFLHISKKEQKLRIDERLKNLSKNWKFSLADVKERKHWNKYMAAFEKMIVATSTKHAPWVVVPADNKWYRDYIVSKTLVDALLKLKMSFPKAET